MSQDIALSGLVPAIEIVSLEAMKIKNEIVRLELQIGELEEVKSRQEQISLLKKNLYTTETLESQLREQGKEIMLQANLKEFKTLDGITLALQFSPWALLIEDESKVPDNFWNEKTTRTIDKIGLKKAIANGEAFEWITIEKDCKFLIKR